MQEIPNHLRSTFNSFHSDMRRRQQQEEGANEKREEREALEWKQVSSGAAGAGAGAAGEGDKNSSTPRNEDVEEAKKVSLETQFM